MAKILLVEDDNNLREIYGARLAAEGYQIVSASDGEEALAISVKEKPDLIISDVMMPRISGFDMLDILRNAPETKDTKVIMMTALSQAEDKARADELGADLYLVKSQVTLEDVAKAVADLLDSDRPGGSGLPPDSPDPPPETPSTPSSPATDNQTQTPDETSASSSVPPVESTPTQAQSGSPDPAPNNPITTDPVASSDPDPAPEPLDGTPDPAPAPDPADVSSDPAPAEEPEPVTDTTPTADPVASSDPDPAPEPLDGTPDPAPAPDPADVSSDPAPAEEPEPATDTTPTADPVASSDPDPAPADEEPAKPGEGTSPDVTAEEATAITESSTVEPEAPSEPTPEPVSSGADKTNTSESPTSTPIQVVLPSTDEEPTSQNSDDPDTKDDKTKLEEAAKSLSSPTAEDETFIGPNLAQALADEESAVNEQIKTFSAPKVDLPVAPAPRDEVATSAPESPEPPTAISIEVNLPEVQEPEVQKTPEPEEPPSKENVEESIPSNLIDNDNPKKRVLHPSDDFLNRKPDIEALVAKEEAMAASENPVPNTVIKPIVDQPSAEENNPDANSYDSVQKAPDEIGKISL